MSAPCLCGDAEAVDLMSALASHGPVEEMSRNQLKECALALVQIDAHDSPGLQLGQQLLRALVGALNELEEETTATVRQERQKAKEFNAYLKELALKRLEADDKELLRVLVLIPLPLGHYLALLFSSDATPAGSGEEAFINCDVVIGHCPRKSSHRSTYRDNTACTDDPKVRKAAHRTQLATRLSLQV
ncbi:unnamed protein product [Chrysoparadoxa australica]